MPDARPHDPGVTPYGRWHQVGNPRVRGRCPACGAESLFLGNNGYVTCAVIGCKDPGAATDLLARPQPAALGKCQVCVDRGIAPSAAIACYAHSTLAIEELKAHIATLLRERAGEVWVWQDDSEDHPESLTCPVLVTAERMRQFVAAENECYRLKEIVDALKAALEPQS